MVDDTGNMWETLEEAREAVRSTGVVETPGVDRFEELVARAIFCVPGWEGVSVLWHTVFVLADPARCGLILADTLRGRGARGRAAIIVGADLLERPEDQQVFEVLTRLAEYCIDAYFCNRGAAECFVLAPILAPAIREFAAARSGGSGALRGNCEGDWHLDAPAIRRAAERLAAWWLERRAAFDRGLSVSPP